MPVPSVRRGLLHLRGVRVVRRVGQGAPPAGLSGTSALEVDGCTGYHGPAAQD